MNRLEPSYRHNFRLWCKVTRTQGIQTLLDGTGPSKDMILTENDKIVKERNNLEQQDTHRARERHGHGGLSCRGCGRRLGESGGAGRGSSGAGAPRGAPRTAMRSDCRRRDLALRRGATEFGEGAPAVGEHR
jgi:hypothetical protein